MPESKNRTAEEWAVFANQLFLAYVRERLGSTPTAWGAWGTTRTVKEPPPIPSRHGAGKLEDFPQAHATSIALGYKNLFAVQMADFPSMPRGADIRDLWTTAMQRAESDIAAYLATVPPCEPLSL
jgi:hypothetical protein